MKFRLYKNFGALNSPPVFEALEQGIKSLGHEIVDNNEDVSVIWSVLWWGRMAGNQKIYDQCIRANKPILIIEVGNLLRGETWRISEGHIHGFGFFGNDQDLDLTRPQKLGVNLKSIGGQRRGEILIATQHNKSLQWAGQPSMEQWVRETIRKIKSHSNRRIVVRPHPRALLREKFVDAVIELPRKIDGTYDSFDINYNYHCVINHNSGPAVQAAINGTPIICDSSSLAFSVSEKWENLENPQLPQREDWFLKLCHTEWTVEELRLGTPIKRLTAHLEEKLKIIS